MIHLAFIGYYGDIVFSVNQDYMLTPKDYEREGGSRWHDHDLILRKPVSQFGGPELEKQKFAIILDATHGVNPETQLKRLREIRDKGIVLPLILNSVPVSQNPWRLDSLHEKDNLFDGEGWRYRCVVELNLTEYDNSNKLAQQFKNILSRLFI